MQLKALYRSVYYCLNVAGCFVVIAALRGGVVGTLRDIIGALGQTAGLQTDRSNAFADLAVAGQSCSALI
jgi:hypothetical protein